MSSPVILTGLALLEAHRRANEAEARARASASEAETSSSDDEEAREDDDDDESDASDASATPARGAEEVNARRMSPSGRAAMGRLSRSASARELASAASGTASGTTSGTTATAAVETSPSVASAKKASEGTCRFCFTGSECGTLIEPCACAGSQAYVHKRCLRRWQRVSYQTRGARETQCRVCHANYTYESKIWSKEARRGPRFWFSFRARDRLNEYSRAWIQSAANALLRRKGVSLPRSASSAGNLALLVAHSEVRIWAGREERREGVTSGLPKLLRVASFLVRAASSYAKVRLLLAPNAAVATAAASS